MVSKELIVSVSRQEGHRHVYLPVEHSFALVVPNGHVAAVWREVKFRSQPDGVSMVRKVGENVAIWEVNLRQNKIKIIYQSSFPSFPIQIFLALSRKTWPCV